MSSPNRQNLIPWALFLGVFVIALAVAFWGLAGDPVHAEKTTEAPAAEVLARVGDTEITSGEVEELVAAELVQVENQRFEAMQKGLDSAVSDRLLELEAAARGTTIEEMLEAEVSSEITEVTDEQVDAFYEERQAQIRAPKEQVAEQIRQYLVQQQRGELTQAMLGGLREKYGVEVFLAAPRIQVAAEGFPAKGPADAEVTIVEFSDFECPFCSRVLPSLTQVRENYADSVRLVFRQFPLNNIHPRAQKAAEASLCAHDQDKFWEMHDAMFAEQKSLEVDQLKEKAARLGLDIEAFNGCLDGDKYAAQVADDLRDGAAAGVSGTPAMFVNGRFVNGAVPYEQLAAIIDEELAGDTAE
jgi:protein-disulfide isomerase